MCLQRERSKGGKKKRRPNKISRELTMCVAISTPPLLLSSSLASTSLLTPPSFPQDSNAPRPVVALAVPCHTAARKAVEGMVARQGATCVVAVAWVLQSVVVVVVVGSPGSLDMRHEVGVVAADVGVGALLHLSVVVAVVVQPLQLLSLLAWHSARHPLHQIPLRPLTHHQTRLQKKKAGGGGGSVGEEEEGQEERRKEGEEKKRRREGRRARASEETKNGKRWWLRLFGIVTCELLDEIKEAHLLFFGVGRGGSGFFSRGLNVPSRFATTSDFSLAKLILCTMHACGVVW